MEKENKKYLTNENSFKWDDGNNLKDKETKKLERDKWLKDREALKLFYSYREKVRKKRYKGGSQ